MNISCSRAGGALSPSRVTVVFFRAITVICERSKSPVKTTASVRTRTPSSACSFTLTFLVALCFIISSLTLIFVSFSSSYSVFHRSLFFTPPPPPHYNNSTIYRNLIFAAVQTYKQQADSTILYEASHSTEQTTLSNCWALELPRC